MKVGEIEMQIHYWKVRKRKDEFVIFPYRKHRGYPIAIVYNLEDAKTICNKHNNMLFHLNGVCFFDIEVSDRDYIKGKSWGRVIEIIELTRMLRIQLDNYCDSNLYHFTLVNNFEKVCQL